MVEKTWSCKTHCEQDAKTDTSGISIFKPNLNFDLNVKHMCKFYLTFKSSQNLKFLPGQKMTI